MSKRPRRNDSLAFKAKVALAAVKAERTMAEMSQQYDVHPNLINQWRSRLLEGAADVYGADHAATEPAVDGTVLHATLGALTLANEFWPVRPGRASGEVATRGSRASAHDRLGSSGRSISLPDAPNVAIPDMGS